MIRLIEFHVLSSGYPVAINPDAVSKIGVVDWDENGVKTDVRGVFISQDNGSSVNVREDYATVKKALSE